jgi:hypothetical protein
MSDDRYFPAALTAVLLTTAGVFFLLGGWFVLALTSPLFFSPF